MNQHYSDDEIRDLARKSLARKSDFWRFLIVGLVACGIVTAVYFFTTPNLDRFFWPGWVYFGVGVAVIFSALNAYGPNSKFTSEERLQREIRRLKGE